MEETDSAGLKEQYEAQSADRRKKKERRRTTKNDSNFVSGNEWRLHFSFSAVCKVVVKFEEKKQAMILQEAQEPRVQDSDKN